MIYIGYIDPGTGVLAIQMLVAGLAATAFFLRNTLARILGLKKKKPDSDSPQDEEKE